MKKVSFSASLLDHQRSTDILVNSIEQETSETVDFGRRTCAEADKNSPMKIRKIMSMNSRIQKV